MASDCQQHREQEDGPDQKQKQEPQQEHRGIYLITYPRTASNLPVRMLALDKQPNVISTEYGGYFFAEAVMRARS